MKRFLYIVTAISLFLGSFFPLSVLAAVHYVGTNVKTADGTVYLVAPNGTRRPYNSAGAFLSYGFNSWSSVVDASADDLDLPVGVQIPPQDGKIICDTKERVGTCFLITDAWKIGFPSADIFYQLGFSFTHALYGDVSFLGEKQNIGSGSEAHRPGVLINKNGTVYLVGDNGLAGIPDAQIFYSWGYNFTDVVTANIADNSLAVVATLPFRSAGQLSPFSAGSTVLQNTKPSVSLSSTAPNGNIQAGSGVTIGRFTITAPQSGSIGIGQIGLAFGGNILPSYLSNLKIIYAPTNTQVGSNSGNVLSNNSGGFVISPPINIASGFSADLIIQADINAAATGSTINSQLTQIWTTNPYGSVDLATVSGVPITGNTLSINNTSTQNGVLSLSQDFSQPFNSTVQSGQNGSIITNIALKNQGSYALGINYLGLKFSSSALQSLSKVHLFSQGVELAASNLNLQPGSVGNDGMPVAYFDFGTQVIPAGATKVFNISADVSSGASGSFTLSLNSVGYDISYVQPTSVTGVPTLFGTITVSNTSNRDPQRVADMRQLATALELYYNDHSAYPPLLTQLTPNYIGLIPTAPTPVEGTCSTSQNSYTYTQLNSDQSYVMTFCLGGVTGGYKAGSHIVTPAGIQ